MKKNFQVPLKESTKKRLAPPTPLRKTPSFITSKSETWNVFHCLVFSAHSHSDEELKSPDLEIASKDQEIFSPAYTQDTGLNFTFFYSQGDPEASCESYADPLLELEPYLVL